MSSEAATTQHEENQDNRLSALEQRIAELETQLVASNDIILGLRKDIVTITADHIQRLFADQILLDSIAQRVFVAGANAIAFKVSKSKERAPELVVVEGYVPGAIRATLTDDGTVLEEQDSETGEWIGGDALSENVRGVATEFGELLIAYGAEMNRAYYIIDNISLEQYRESVSAKIMETREAVSEVEAE
jgi:uncharacterized coiled-coil protein SlyX